MFCALKPIHKNIYFICDRVCVCIYFHIYTPHHQRGESRSGARNATSSVACLNECISAWSTQWQANHVELMGALGKIAAAPEAQNAQARSEPEEPLSRQPPPDGSSERRGSRHSFVSYFTFASCVLLRNSFILYTQLYLPAVVKCFVLSLYRDTVLQAIFMLPEVHYCGGDSKAEIVLAGHGQPVCSRLHPQHWEIPRL